MVLRSFPLPLNLAPRRCHVSTDCSACFFQFLIIVTKRGTHCRYNCESAIALTALRNLNDDRVLNGKFVAVIVIGLRCTSGICDGHSER